MIAMFILLSLAETRAVQATDDFHAHHHHSTKTHSAPDFFESSTASPAPTSSYPTSLPLVNQHALLQVRVSADCPLDAEKNSLQQSTNDAMKPDETTSWFVQITELPRVNIPIESSIHLNQAVDLNWKPLNALAFQGNASLSFLIPLTDSSGERTLIVSLMEYSGSHSRILTRRLANLPVSFTSGAAPAKSRTNPLVHVELSTTTLKCMTNRNKDSSIPNNVHYSNASIATLVVLALGLVCFASPKRIVAFDDENEQVEHIQEALQHEGSSVENDDDQASVSPSRLRRVIVIDSPVSNDSTSTAKQDDDQDQDEDGAREEQQHEQESTDSSTSKPKSHIIKPPSLVRIPYSFAAEHENEEATSTLSADDTEQPSMAAAVRESLPSVGVHETALVAGMTKDVEMKDSEAAADDEVENALPAAPQDPTTMGVSEDAFPSPVVDVKRSATENESEITTTCDKKNESEMALDSYETPMVIDQGGNEQVDGAGAAETDDTAGDSKENNDFSRSIEKELFKGDSDSRRETSLTADETETSEEQVSMEIDSPVESNGDDDAPTASSPSGTFTNEANTSQEGDDGSPSLHEASRSFSERNDSDVSAESARTFTQDQQDSRDEETRSLPEEPENEPESTAAATASKDNDSGDREALDNDAQSSSKPKEASSVGDLNWLLRMKKSSKAQADTTQNDKIPGAKKEDNSKMDDMSYVSTLPPDSDSYDDNDFPDCPFECAISPIVTTKRASSPNENQTEVVATDPSDREQAFPPRRKRRLGLLRTRNNVDRGQAHQSFETPASGQDLDTSAKSALPDPPARLSYTTAKNPSECSTKRRAPKKSPADTIVPDVVPSVFLQTAANSIAGDWDFDFTKAASLPPPVRVKKEKGSSSSSQKEPSRSRRKRKDPPPSTIALPNGGYQHSIVSRGSSQVTKKRKLVKT